MTEDMISRERLIRKLEAWDKGANGIPNYVWKVIKELQCEDKGEISDGYHTFNQLYHQRAVLFATIVNQNKEKAWKSYKHSDGKYCFDSDGEWFIVGVDTPEGSFTYHYAKEYWDMFHCEELEVGKEWDGHTEDDVTRLLTLEQQSWDDAISRKKVDRIIQKWLAHKDYELKDHIYDMTKAINKLPSVNATERVKQ